MRHLFHLAHNKATDGIEIEYVHVIILHHCSAEREPGRGGPTIDGIDL
jgi:hypothetical protein